MRIHRLQLSSSTDTLEVTLRGYDHELVRATWKGGPYIELAFGGHTQPVEVINVWDYATNSSDLPFKDSALVKKLHDWVDSSNRENPGWYKQYLEQYR